MYPRAGHSRLCMRPLNETVQGLEMDVLWVTHTGSAHHFNLTYYKNTADFLQKEKGESVAPKQFIFYMGSWANIQEFEEPHYHQAALLQSQEGCGKLPLFLKEEVLWFGRPFISEGDSSFWLSLGFLLPLHLQ